MGLIFAVSLLLLFVIWRSVGPRWAWFGAFAGDLWQWILEPEIADGWSMPAGLAIAVPVATAITFQGWLATRLLLSGSYLNGERWIELGLTITIAISLLGFGGVLCVVLGRLGRLELLMFYAVTGAALAWAWWRLGARQASSDTVAGPGRPRSPWILRAIAAAVFAIAVAFSLAHATLTPVQEWDATIYHAESARLWFRERPDPPIRYGPSIGIEISSNYPPLFPAAGAAAYTLVGEASDLYLRVLPPLLLAAVMAMVFGFARRSSGPLGADLALLLVAGSPLLLAYGVWTTGYALLGALLVAVVILVDLAADRDGLGPWAGAGAVAGLAILSHFYGVVALLAAVAALATRRPVRWKGAAVFAGIAIVAASPWLGRNLLLLGDPFYPLGTPPFSGKGLVEPLWSASKAGISNKALSFWSGATGFGLTLRQLATSLFDRQLLMTGCYFGLWFGLIQWRRRPRAAYLAAFVAGFIVLLLLQGWFWFRALLPLIPIAALLTASLLAWLVESIGKAVEQRRDLVHMSVGGVVIAAVGATVVASAVAGTSFAIAGPVISRGESDDMMRTVREWGAPRVQLWTVFGGDLLLWEWLNQNIGPGERFATLEIRMYYLDRPETAFYLDGIEAVPLLEVEDPAAAERFFSRHGVRYVVIPSWAVRDPTGRSVAGLLPLFDFLGSDRFPAVAAFPVGDTDRSGVVYSVGPTEEARRVGFAGTVQAMPPDVGQTSAIFAAEQSASRIFVPTSRTAAVALRFDYEARSGVDFDLRVLSQRGIHRLTYLDVPAATPGWRTALIPLPSVPEALTNLALRPHRADLTIRDVRLETLTEPLVLAPAGDMPGTYQLVAGEGGRVHVPVTSDDATLRLEVRDHGRGRLEILARRGAVWKEIDSVELTGSGRWEIRGVRLQPDEPGFIELWLRSVRTDAELKNVSLMP